MKKQENSKENTSYKAHTATKRIGVMMLVSFFLLLLIENVSAFDFDNIGRYNETSRTFTIKNSVLGIPFFQLGTVAEIHLDTPNVVYVIRGQNKKVAEFTINNYGDYSNALKKMEFYDIKKDMEEFERDFIYKYKKSLGFETVNDYETICEDKTSLNGTKYQECHKELTGTTHQEERFEWIELDTSKELPTGQITIGIFTDVYDGDKVEWIPTLFGVRIDEWASWKESLNVGLIAYYKLDETSGDAIDSLGVYNLTNFGVNQGESGLINNSARWDGGTTDNMSNPDFLTTTNSMNMWVNLTQAADYDTFFVLDDGTNNFVIVHHTGGIRINDYNGTLTQTTPIDFSSYLNKWTMITSIENGTNNLYLDGTHVSQSDAITQAWGTVFMVLGNSRTLSRSLYGKVDEVGIWNRTLTSSEITDLYNSGDGLSYEISGLTIILNSPIDNYNSTSATITFNGTVYSLTEKDITNVSLYIDGILNETNSSGINNTDYTFTKTFSDGNYNWTYGTCNSENDCKTATTRDFTIDTTAPIVNITYPINIVFFRYDDRPNETLNWTIIDTNLDSCWFNYNFTNTTITCNTNTTEFNLTNQRNITLWANDTLGNIDNDYLEWEYVSIEISKTFNASSFETAEETFIMNITTNGTIPTNGKLVYNGTSYSATITNTAGNDYNISRTIDIPIVTGNKTFFFNFTIMDTEVNSTISTQLINSTSFIHCIIGTPFINVSFKNETISEEAITATISSTWNYWLGSGTIFKTLSFSNTSENSYYPFCLDGINETLETNVSLIYKNSISQQRNFKGSFSLTNVTTNQSLYLLPTADGVYVTFQVINIAEQPVSGVLSNVTKTGVLISSGTTDDAGTISYFLNPDSSYTFTFFKIGYDIYVTTLTPTQTTFTITLGGEEVVEEDDYTRGITYLISPGAISLVNNTETYFNFTLVSTYWDVEEFGFNLTNQSGALLNSTSATTNGGTVFVFHDTSNDTIITMTFFWTISGNVSIGSVFWTVLDSSGTGWGLTTFFTHLKAYSDTEMFGLNANSMVILVYIIIFITTGIMSFKYGIRSPAAISLMIFGFAFLFEVHLGWIPSISNIPILTILFALISIALIIREGLK